ncbi:MAG: hypothetical protein ACYS1C_01700 [Planctomycetota bacterium]
MPGLDFNVFALALLAGAAVAFTRQRRVVSLACGALFVPAAAIGAVAVWWSVSPALTLVLLALTLGLPLLALLLWAVDLAFAPFCVEMTYPAMICWLLWPALVMANFAALALA